MKVHLGLNKVADDLYFIAQPMGKIYTGITVLLGSRIALVDSGMPPALEKYILPALTQAGRMISDIDIVVNTHWHATHVGCNRQIREQARATIAVHAKDKPCMESLDAQRTQFYSRFPKHFPPSPGNPAPTCPVDLVLRTGDRLKLGERQFDVIHLPGHTPGSIALYDRTNRLLLSGDSIQGCGLQGHIAMVEDVTSYLESLHMVEQLDVACVIMNHPYTPFDSTIVSGNDVLRLLRVSIQTMEQYIAALTDFVARRTIVNLAEATDLLCARFGSQPWSLMAMCTADSILKGLGVAYEDA